MDRVSCLDLVRQKIKTDCDVSPQSNKKRKSVKIPSEF